MKVTTYNIDNRRGGVAFRVVVCVTSLLVLAGAIVALLNTFETGKADDLRRAEIISAYGIQEAYRKLAESNMEWDAGFQNEPFSHEEGEEAGSYSVAVTRETRGDSLYIKIVSTATVGSISQTQTEERAIHIGNSDGGAGKSSDGGAPGNNTSISSEGGK